MPMNDIIASFPLAWPVGWARTTRRARAPYRTSCGDARDHLVRELHLLGARQITISSNLTTRVDGLPLSSGKLLRPDPGVAVYWNHGKSSHVMACDRWNTATDNMHAIGLSISAIRALKRAGTSEILERAFAGFGRLPANGSDSSWRSIFAIDDTLDAAAQLQQLKRAYAQLLLKKHPDHGGSHEDFLRISSAYSAGVAELGGA